MYLMKMSMKITNLERGLWALVASVAVLFVFFTTRVQAAPRTPPDSATVIERLPFRAGDTVSRSLADLRSAVLKSPTSVDAAVALAQAYFDLALARGDPRYIGYADAVVTRILASATSATPDVLLMRGMLRQYRHDFSGALSDFAAALVKDPELAGAHAWRGAIYLVEAQYTQASGECDALLRLQRPVLYGGCTGLLQAYTGQLDPAYATLQQALMKTTDNGLHLWLHTRLAEVAAWQGQPDKAERHYRLAVALGQDDGYLLAAWADFLLDADRPAEVEKMLSGWEASDVLLLRLAEAEVLLKRPASNAHIQVLGDRFAAAKLRGDTTHQAEEARFQLRLRGNPALSVQLAAANYAAQKEPRDARILLEAALAAQNPAAAKPVMDWLQRSGFKDRRTLALAAQLAPPPAPINASKPAGAP